MHIIQNYIKFSPKNVLSKYRAHAAELIFIWILVLIFFFQPISHSTFMNVRYDRKE